MIDFITFCCYKDWERLYANLPAIVGSHNFWFDHVYVMRQRLADDQRRPIPGPIDTNEVIEVDVDEGVIERHIPLPDEKAEQYTGPSNRAHYWKNHVMNHLMGMEVSEADYILFQDSDVYLKSGEPHLSWVELGTHILRLKEDALIVTPNWGGADGIAYQDENAWYCNTVSQQIFLIERERMLGIDFAVPWDWEKLAPFGPMQEFYYMLEGRLWRWMDPRSLKRAVLKKYRYWHGQW